MIVLSCDSSSKVASVSLLCDNGLICEYTINNKREHSTILMPLIDKILKQNNLTLHDIDGFVISKGPGSFTGLRIGMSTIKGLSFGTKKPYISISSLEGLAYKAYPFEGIICPIMDALRENVYTALYKCLNDGNLHNILEANSMNIDELAILLNSKNEKILFTGDGVLKHKDYLMKNVNNCFFVPNTSLNVNASSIGEIGLKLIKKGVFDDPDSDPMYLKKPQAQRELERRLLLNELNS